MIIEIPVYQWHKRVRALKIKAVVPNPRGVELHFEDERFVPIQVGWEWVRQYLISDNGTNQLIGGYAVWHDNESMSWSPAEDFEAGYTLIEELPAGQATQAAQKILNDWLGDFAPRILATNSASRSDDQASAGLTRQALTAATAIPGADRAHRQPRGTP